MNKNFYSRLAASNLRKNSRTYLPYMLASIFSIAMFYIMYMMSQSGYFKHASFEQILWFGDIVIAIFSVIFLFYTNSFLIKRRMKEFGLFNVLGLDKRHIAKVIALETIYTSVISLVLGIGAGVLFSKLIYLILENIIDFKLHDKAMFSSESVVATAILFTAIFFLTLLNSLRLIHLSKPIELLRGGQKGEKEPKIKWILTIMGVASLGTGYYLAITITNPLDALLYFFVAVILVIIGTYCLFTSISIFVLKLLKKNKNYYYRTDHFISVSSMMYRMKQNAVGLANICILSTIVLVTISTTVSLYAGVDDIMNQRYPRDIAVRVNYSVEQIDGVRNNMNTVLDGSGYKISNKNEARFYSGILGKTENSFEHWADFTNQSKEKEYELVVMPVDDYNKATGENVNLSKGEALIYTDDKPYDKKTLKLGTREFNIKSAQTFKDKTKASNYLSAFSKFAAVNTFCIIVSDLDAANDIREDSAAAYRKADFTEDEINDLSKIKVLFDFDVDATNPQQVELVSQLKKAMKEQDEDGNFEAPYIESRSANYKDFYESYGGMLFIGMYLGVLFIMATILIIYYKQISEGYEDKERFRIMQNVGLTKREVKKAIRSQVLTMFFMPLIVACVHISFAFPMISKLLMLFNLRDTGLFMVCMLICAGVFAVLYIIVYSLTSRLYYKIVEEG